MRSSQATRSRLAGVASQEARGPARRRLNRVAARASRGRGGRRPDMRSDRRTACGTTPEATAERCEDRTTRYSPPECCSNLQAPQRRVCQRRVAGTTRHTRPPAQRHTSAAIVSLPHGPAPAERRPPDHGNVCVGADERQFHAPIAPAGPCGTWRQQFDDTADDTLSTVDGHELPAEAAESASLVIKAPLTRRSGRRLGGATE